MFRVSILCYLLVLGVHAMATEKATFAGGCFWCMEADFEKVSGVIEVVSGYTGGHEQNPSYNQVSNGNTDHAEAVRVTFDPETVSYPELLTIFWKNIDPTVKDRQFCDVGSQYRTAIFYHTDMQKQQVLESLEEIKANHDITIMTEIVPASIFYPAEEYHQSYYKKNPIRYRYYRYSCGRDKRLKEIWGSS